MTVSAMGRNTRKKSSESNFNFAKWCQASSLDKTSVKLLKDNGLNEEQTLLLLKPKDLTVLQLSLGQELLLSQALQEMGAKHFQEVSDPKSAASVAEDDNHDDEDQDEVETATANKELPKDPLLVAGAELDALLGGVSLAQPNQHDGSNWTPKTLDPAPVTDAYDPRILLTAKSSSGRKAEKIYNFLPEKVQQRIQRRKRERMVLSQCEDGRISLLQNDEEQYNISISEWGAANMKLMAHLLSKGDLQRCQVEYYLSYTMQVFQLADSYDWNSVLMFDSRYRDLQAAHNFLWGDMRMALQLQLLTPKRFHPSGQSQPSKGAANPKVECKMWNNSNGSYCAYGTSCRFLHKDLPPKGHKDSKNDSQ